MNADKKSVVQLVAIQKCSPSLSPSLSTDISHSPFSPVHTHTRIIQKYIIIYYIYDVCVSVRVSCWLLAVLSWQGNCLSGSLGIAKHPNAFPVEHVHTAGGSRSALFWQNFFEANGTNQEVGHVSHGAR